MCNRAFTSTPMCPILRAPELSMERSAFRLFPVFPMQIPQAMARAIGIDTPTDYDGAHGGEPGGYLLHGELIGTGRFSRRVDRPDRVYDPEKRRPALPPAEPIGHGVRNHDVRRRRRRLRPHASAGRRIFDPARKRRQRQSFRDVPRPRRRFLPLAGYARYTTADSARGCICDCRVPRCESLR